MMQIVFITIQKINLLFVIFSNKNTSSPASTTTVFHTYHSANSRPIFERNIQCSIVPKPLNLPSLTPPRKAMTLPSPTTLHHQTTVHFSTTFISTLTKLFSRSDYHHVSRFIDCLKQGKPKPKPDCMFIHFLIFLLHLVTFFIHIPNQNSTSCHLCFLKFSSSNLGQTY